MHYPPAKKTLEKIFFDIKNKNGSALSCGPWKLSIWYVFLRATPVDHEDPEKPPSQFSFFYSGMFWLPQPSYLTPANLTLFFLCAVSWAGVGFCEGGLWKGVRMWARACKSEGFLCERTREIERKIRLSEPFEFSMCPREVTYIHIIVCTYVYIPKTFASIKILPHNHI